MKIKGMHLSNFLGIKEANMTFSSYSGLTLIDGINNDSSTASSNGAGKSSLFEGLLFGLYGATKRGLRADAVINRNNKKAGCKVSVIFTSGGVEYLIVRTRKDKKDGDSLKLFSGSTDLTKGTSKETQALIDDLIKVSQTVFEKSVYFGQEDVKSFAALTDRELKQVFEEALGLLVFSEGEMKVKGYRSGLIEDRTLIAHEIEKIQNNIKHSKSDLIHVKEAIKTLNNTTKEKKESLIASKKALKIEKDELNEKLGKEPEADPAIAELKKSLNGLEKLSDKLAEKHTEKRDEFLKITAEVKRVLARLENDKKSKAAAGDKIGKKCPTCGQIFDAKTIETYIDALDQTILKDVNRIKEIRASVEEKKAEVEKLERLFAPLSEKIKTVRENAEKLAIKQEGIIKRNDEIRRRIAFIDNDFAVVFPAKAKGIKDQHDEQKLTLNGKKAGFEANIKTYENQLIEKKERIYQIAKKLLVVEMLLDALGNQGAKSYVFDSITPELNESIAKNMAFLDPDMSVELSTMKKLKSGEYREKFELIVDNKNGAGEYKGNSGGEKGKIDIAISLGLNSLMRAMGADVGLCFFDEPFENLDVEASEAVVELLRDIDADNIFITSHNPAIKDLIINKITMVKNGGFSTMAA